MSLLSERPPRSLPAGKVFLQVHGPWRSKTTFAAYHIKAQRRLRSQTKGRDGQEQSLTGIMASQTCHPMSLTTKCVDKKKKHGQTGVEAVVQ